MTDGSYDPVNDDDRSDEVIDLDLAFGEDGTDIIETSYSPPEKPLGLNTFGTTAEEELHGESLDARLAREEPDPALEVDLVPDGVLDDGVLDDGVLDDGEVGEARAGRLVESDQGAREDAEKDMVATDVGIDAGAASAEEAAVHIVDSERVAIDEGSSR